MKTYKSFKQAISDVFTLKYRTLTLLLGTFVPFFAAHVFAYAMSEAREIIMQKESHYFLNLFAGLVFFLIFYGIIIIIPFWFLRSLLPSVSNFFFFLPFLILVLLLNFGISWIYYPFYKKNI